MDEELAEAIFRQWLVLLEGKGDSLMFTLDDGETWDDKADEIAETIRKKMETKR